MGLITVNAFNANTRQFEPLLLNTDFIVQAASLEIGKGVRSAVQLGLTGEVKALRETLEELEDLIQSISDSDYLGRKKLERILGPKR